MAQKMIIDRQKDTWVVTSPGGAILEQLPDECDARAAIISVQKRHPAAEVGVASSVFGAGSERTFGPVVWVKRRLE